MIGKLSAGILALSLAVCFPQAAWADNAPANNASRDYHDDHGGGHPTGSDHHDHHDFYQSGNVEYLGVGQPGCPNGSWLFAARGYRSGWWWITPEGAWYPYPLPISCPVVPPPAVISTPYGAQLPVPDMWANVPYPAAAAP